MSYTPETTLQPVTPWTTQEVGAMLVAAYAPKTALQKVKPRPVQKVETQTRGSPFSHLPSGAKKIIEFAITFGPCTYDHVGERTGMTGAHAARTLKSAAANGYIKAATRMVTTGSYVRPNIFYSGVAA